MLATASWRCPTSERFLLPLMPSLARCGPSSHAGQKNSCWPWSLCWHAPPHVCCPPITPNVLCAITPNVSVQVRPGGADRGARLRAGRHAAAPGLEAHGQALFVAFLLQTPLVALLVLLTLLLEGRHAAPPGLEAHRCACWFMFVTLKRCLGALLSLVDWHTAAPGLRRQAWALSCAQVC